MLSHSPARSVGALLALCGRWAVPRRDALRALLPFVVLGLAFSGCADQRPTLVLAGGRVVDPQSGLDGVRWVAIDDGRVVQISERPLGGRRVLDVTGLVIAPGFVDLHAPTPDSSAMATLALAGVTSALRLGSGVHPVDEWYRALEEMGPPIHFGAAVSYSGARAQPFAAAGGDRSTGLDQPLDGAEMEMLVRRVRLGLADGALGLGFALDEVPGATGPEIEDLFAVAGFDRIPVFARSRDGGPLALDELLTAAGLLGTTLHVVDLAGGDAEPLDLSLARIDRARAAGLDVTADVGVAGPEASVLTALGHSGVILTGDAGGGGFLRALAPHLRGSPGLVDVLARFTLLPALLLEDLAADFGRKGRVQVGADADLVALDPETNAVRHVVVGGTPVVRNGMLVPGARPGKPLRAAGSE